MFSLHRRARSVVAGTVALAACGSLALTGTAVADSPPHPVAARLPGAPAVVSAPLVPGLYQSAYSERNDVLWATAALGQPPAPVSGSTLVKADPDTLRVLAAYTPPPDATGVVEAVYGIDVDDEHNTVWVTNTRSDSVAVYSQRTGEHLATLPGVAHSREVVVDERHDTVWASGYGDGTLVAYDSRTYREIRRVTVEGAGPTGLAVNERTGTVYAADHTHGRIIEVTRGSDAPRFVPTGAGPLSVALSADGRTAYTADQTAGTVSVVDLRAGAVTRTVTTGEGAKSLAVQPRSGRVLVVNRLAGNVSVVDPRAGTVLATVTTAALPNHVRISEDGTAYVVDKSGAGTDGADLLTRVRPRR
ncbi:YncE family protein [Streptomyces sp. AM 2-1-1]|uniref:YncE family protein n=1 Tax=unclassified Streptomyces TaxID=2593676 RepID=UPI0023B8DD19|nr:YncE family protein [Streptomyces sp. AM 2-1-1]WEH43325.1 YncE family protein [Streptomyces sp. AM 2-1-1]